MGSSLAQSDYAVTKPAERPVIKKLVDNLQVSGGALEAKPSLRTDYPEFEVKRPVIHRLTDQLKTSGVQSSEGEFATSTLSRDQYRPFSVKRPEGGRKLRSSLKVRGHLDAVSTSRSQYQVFKFFQWPVMARPVHTREAKKVTKHRHRGSQIIIIIINKKIIYRR